MFRLATPRAVGIMWRAHIVARHMMHDAGCE